MAEPGRVDPDAGQLTETGSGSPPGAGPARPGPNGRPGLLAQEGARSAAVATTSTVVFVAVAATLVLTSPNWPRVQRQFFSPDDFADAARQILARHIAGRWWIDFVEHHRLQLRQ